MVACQTCANLCPVGAVSFVKAPQTTREKAQKIVRKFKILSRIKKELEDRKEELRYNR
jgi:formate hydrogenlyase subunit 6/NADH:ubiquinone oxidoreductase subunit I